MFHCTPGRSQRLNALREDLIHFANDRNLGRHLHDGQMRLQDAANFISFSRSSADFEADTSSRGSRSLRYSIRDFVAMELQQAKSPAVASDSFPLALLPRVLEEFINIGAPLGEDDVAYVLRHIHKPPRAAMQKSQRASGVNPNPLVATAPAGSQLVVAEATQDHCAGYDGSASLLVPVAKYSDYSPDELVATLCRRDQEISDLLDERRQLVQNRNHFQRRADGLKAQLVQSRRELDALVAQVKFRPGLRNVSSFGGYTMALKRNVGHTSASAAIQMLGGDQINGGFVDPKIVWAFEHKTCIAQRISSALDFESMAEVQTSSAECVEVFGFLGDATHQDFLVHLRVVEGHMEVVA